MIPDSLRVVTSELPYRLRADVEDYVNAVDAVAPAIATYVKVGLTGDLRERFLFLVGVRRLWAAMDGSHRLASNARAVHEWGNASLVSAGNVHLGRGSEFGQELRRLRSGVLAVLTENAIHEAVNLTRVSSVCQGVAVRGHRREALRRSNSALWRSQLLEVAVAGQASSN